MIDIKQYRVWFITGSQHLYGPGVLQQVAENSTNIVQALNGSEAVPFPLQCKPVVTSPEMILNVMRDANNDTQCVGVITWMHTFSPAKMWIAGSRLSRNRSCIFIRSSTGISVDKIDMDFMNLNQAAHGDREFGFICTRMRIKRKVVVGHWQGRRPGEVGSWMRVAASLADMQRCEGCPLRRQHAGSGSHRRGQSGSGERSWISVNGYGLGDLVQCVNSVPEASMKQLVKEYDAEYILAPAARRGGEKRTNLVECARIELGLRAFLEAGN